MSNKSDKAYKVTEIDGKPVYRYHIQMKSIETSNTDIYVKCNFLEFKNQGNCNVILDHSRTLEPGETFSLGSMEMLHICEQWIHVFFDVDTAPGGKAEAEPRLERVEIQLPHPDLLKRDR